MDKEKETIKLLTLGDSGVGKSWLLLRWASEGNSFEKKVKNAPPMSTIGIDFKNKTVEINGQKVKLQIWDTAGQERFRTITTSYYRTSHGILLVYDITNKDSFNNIRVWVEQIQKHADANINKILLGNKCDLQRQRNVTYEEGEALAREYNIPFFETSAMDDINVEHAFMTIATNVKVRLDSAIKINNNNSNNNKTDLTNNGVSLSENNATPKKKDFVEGRNNKFVI